MTPMRRPVSLLLLLVALVAGCGTASTGTLDGTGNLAERAARAAADDTVADALGTRLSLLTRVCDAAAARVDGTVEWAGLHCTIDVGTDGPWTIGMIDEGADADPFRRTLRTLTDEIPVSDLGDEAWYDPESSTLYDDFGGDAFFLTWRGTPDPPVVIADAMREILGSAVAAATRG